MIGILGLTFWLLLPEQVDAATCYYYRFGYYSSKSCYYGCCDSYSSDPCCSYSSYYYYYYTYNSVYDLLKNTDVVSTGVIAGSVVGGLIGLALLITIIVCVCRACNRQNATLGQVITQPGVPYVAFPGPNVQPQQYMNGGNINGGFMMGPIYPGYSLDNLATAAPCDTVIPVDSHNQQLSCAAETASQQTSLTQKTILAPNENKCLSPEGEKIT